LFGKTGSFGKFRKEGCEKEMAQIEKDIEKLNKQIVFVDLKR
jgi:hypothetical protein